MRVPSGPIAAYGLGQLATAAILAPLLALSACSKSGEGSAARSDQPVEEPRPSEPPAKRAAALPDTLPHGLLLAYVQFQISPEGQVLPKPGAARLELLTRSEGSWSTEVLEDPDSNVFHKAMLYSPAGQPPSILTIGGMAANVKLWRRQSDRFEAQTLWNEDFGGKFSRMRDVEVADLYGDGRPDIAVGTHDQGVVAVLRHQGGDQYRVERLHREPDTFIHEIEIGDLDRDGIPEVYASSSEPNRFEGHQTGKILRFVPGDPKQREAKVVAEVAKRHAKEISIADMDGDGREELYVAMEALTEGKDPDVRIVEPVQILRYDHDTPADQGRVVASIEDRFCRFLTVGDPDGSGKKVMVAAAYRSGLWLLTPQQDPKAPWRVTSLDRNSSGFEHAALFADLDGDGRDELYVAADDQGELRRYTWSGGKPTREVIHRRDTPGAMMTWNIMPVPTSILQPEQ